MKHINVMPNGLPINIPAAMPMLFPEASSAPPALPNSRIGKLLPHHWISADYSLPSWEGQTEHPGKAKGEEQQAQER